MKDLYFFAYHGSMLIILGILPYILASFTEKTLEIFFILAAIISLELLVIGLTSITSPKTSKFIRSAWGAVLGIIAIFSFIQIYYFLKTQGGTLNWQLIRYAIDNREYVMPIIQSEISVLWWARFLVVIPMLYMFSQAGWKATQPQNTHRRSLAFICIALSIALLSGKSGLAAAYYLSPSHQENKNTTRTVDRYVNNRSIKTLINAQASQDLNYNVVIIILESIRANATTPYGSEFNTTPFLNSLANTGLKAEQAYVVTPHTSKSVAAILCGYPPDVQSRSIIEARPEGLPFSCLPHLLKTLGYNSAFFQTATERFESRDKLIKNIGFDHFVPKEKIDKKDWETTNYFGYEDKAMIEPAMNWVDKQEEPFLLSMLTLTSHHNYKVPSTFEKKHYADGKMFNDYLNTIKYTDDFLFEVWTEFEKRNLIDNTLFVFISDHGERFEGDRTLGHHQTLAQDAIHIPFIVWNPNLIPRGKSISGPRQQIDVVPTVLDLLDIKTTNNHELFGISLLEPAKNRTIFTHCLFGNCTGKISGNQKFIYINSRNYQLYDVIRDPKEEMDLSSITNFSQTHMDQYLKEINSWKQAIKNLYH